MGSYSAASVVIRALFPLLARGFTAWQLMILSFALTGLAFLIIPSVTGVPGLVALSFCIGLDIGLSGPLSQALLYEASPPERAGEVMGLRVTAMNISQTVVPMASGAAGAALGVAPVFWAPALVLIGGTWAIRAQWHQGRHQDSA